MEKDNRVVKNVYSCYICEKKFTKHKKLKVHFIIHSNEAQNQSETSDENIGEKEELLKNLAQKIETSSIYSTANNINNDSSTTPLHLDSKVTKESEISERKCSTESKVKNNLEIHAKEKCASEVCKITIDKKSSSRSHFCSPSKERKGGSELRDEAISEEHNLLGYRNEKLYYCEICGKEFGTKQNLTTHLRKHTKEKPYTCEICNRNFAQSSNLKRHIRIHTNEKPYTCEICNKSFIQSSALISHLRIIHSNVKTHFCEVCGRAFGFKRNLKKHLLTHTKYKPHVCEICNKGFNKKGNLKHHLLVHTEEIPHSCLFCGKAFKYKSNLREHLRVHTKEKPYACDVCEESFAYLRRLKSHLISHKKT